MLLGYVRVRAVGNDFAELIGGGMNAWKVWEVEVYLLPDIHIQQI